MNDYERISGHKLPATITPGSVIAWGDVNGTAYQFNCQGGLISSKPYTSGTALSLADLQLEAIRGVLEEVLTTSGSPHPAVWGPWLLGEIGRILDMTQGLEVMGVLADQEERRVKD